jgi:acyl-CoA synthetase (AMP-forming)/AMP-acid ligase II
MSVNQSFNIGKTHHQIASQDVENAFYADNCVAEAAAIGVPDERLGELVGVIVSLHPSSLEVTESDLLESVRPR